MRRPRDAVPGDARRERQTQVNHQAGAKQSGRSGPDRLDGPYLRNSRYVRPSEYRKDRIPRLHPSDELGRGGPSRGGAPRDRGEICEDEDSSVARLSGPISQRRGPESSDGQP